MSTKQHLRKFVRAIIQARAEDKRENLKTEELRAIFESAAMSFSKDQLVKVVIYICINIEEMAETLERMSQEEITLLKAKNNQ